MARIVQNPLGGIHSVPDDFEFPTTEDGKPVDGWKDLKDKDAPAALLGTEPDPQVAAVESHNGGHDIPETPSVDTVGTIPQEGSK